jgi:conjugative transposon TraM protein
MKVNFKSPRYMIPLIILPFLCLFFYVYQSSIGKPKPVAKGKDSLQDNVADVSDQVKKSTLSDKLDAYRDQYRKSDGYTAIGKLQDEEKAGQTTPDLYNEQEKHLLDSIEQSLGKKYNKQNKLSPLSGGFPDTYGGAKRKTAAVSTSDQELATALNKMRARQQQSQSAVPKDDPMQLFRQQMALIDSMGKAHDPAYQAAQQRKQQQQSDEQQIKPPKTLPVSKAELSSALFNTISPPHANQLITAIIDQDIAGYAGSRLRIRLLDDFMAGRYLIKQGTYLYAQISGFSGQRVMLTVSSILQEGRILPVKLELYDNDGLPGLYVPASAFRDFTKDLGGNAGQGMSLQQQADNNNQIVMSVVQKMFESTTTAVSKLIRQNKAKLKYNTLVYLIDPEEIRKPNNN